MSDALNPGNVPLAPQGRRISATYRCTDSQRMFLDDLLCREEMLPAELYGDGFRSLGELSSWATSWGITELDRIGRARCAAEADRALEEETEQSMKAWIANYYRARARG
jgi:hypothetical protein